MELNEYNFIMIIVVISNHLYDVISYIIRLLNPTRDIR